VIGTDQGKQSIYLKKGEIQLFGQHRHSISFEGSEEADILIREVDSGLTFIGKRETSVFKMLTQSAGMIPKEQWHSLDMNALHRSGDLSFVPAAYTKNASLQWCRHPTNHRIMTTRKKIFCSLRSASGKSRK
jgi:hypothetical protein